MNYSDKVGVFTSCEAVARGTLYSGLLTGSFDRVYGWISAAVWRDSYTELGKCIPGFTTHTKHQTFGIRIQQPGGLAQCTTRASLLLQLETEPIGVFLVHKLIVLWAALLYILMDPIDLDLKLETRQYGIIQMVRGRG
jgi:hypothetical protein